MNDGNDNYYVGEKVLRNLTFFCFFLFSIQWNLLNNIIPSLITVVPHLMDRSAIPFLQKWGDWESVKSTTILSTLLVIHQCPYRVVSPVADILQFFFLYNLIMWELEGVEGTFKNVL